MKRLYAEPSRTSISAVAESFTEDIVIEILLRLQAKSLMRFKCVAKRWQSLISDPGFAKSHLQRLETGDIISSQRIFKTRPLETINYEALDGGIGAVVKFHEPIMDIPNRGPLLVGSCNGLVCLSVHGGFVLYNPTTKESRNLPGSDHFRMDNFIRGFGYDSRSDDYKIVQHKGTDGSEEWELVIFSLKSGSWRRTQARYERHFCLVETGRGVYWNGALHWCLSYQSTEKTEIVSFDLSEEKFQQVLSVPEVSGYGRIGYGHFRGLGIHGANLFIYHVNYDDCLRAWTTSEYGKGGSWTKLFSVSTEGIPTYYKYGVPIPRYWERIPVAYTRSGKIVFQLSMHEQIILLNPEDNTYRNYPIQKSGYIASAIYVETLVSPYLGCEPSRI